VSERDDERDVDYLVDVDESFLSALVQRGSDVVLTIDTDSRVVFTNDTIEDALGYEPADVVGEELTTVMPERFQDSHFESMGAYLETGDRSLDWSDIQLPAEHADGHEVPLDITFHEHVHDGQRLFSGIMTDVTEQTRYENRLRALQETTEELMDADDAAAIASTVVAAADDVLGFPLATVFVADDDDRVLTPLAASECAVELFDGVPDLGADSLAWRVYASDEEGTYADVREADGVNYADTPVRGEVLLPLSDHGVLALGRRVVGEPDDDELDLAKVLASATEAGLDRAVRERELRERERDLRRQNERLDEFASVVSHDLRDPLNAASMQVELLRADVGENEYLERLGEIHDRMAALVEDVLALTREGRTVGDTERVDVEGVARAAWGTAGAPAASLDVAGDAGTVDADPERLRTVFENLLGNAVHHAGDDVAVTVGGLDDAAGFYVADDGPGIPEAERDAVFDHGHSDAHDGTGLGLSIVQSIAHAHGWTIRLTDAADGGARFEFHTDPAA